MELSLQMQRVPRDGFHGPGDCLCRLILLSLQPLNNKSDSHLHRIYTALSITRQRRFRVKRHVCYLCKHYFICGLQCPQILPSLGVLEPVIHEYQGLAVLEN